MVYIHAQAYGTATITVIDGGETYQYTLEIYKEDEDAHMRITPAGQDKS